MRSGSLFFCIDEALNMVDWNQDFASFMGKSENDFASHPLGTFTHPEDASAVQEAISTLLATGGRATVEARLKRRFVPLGVALERDVDILDGDGQELRTRLGVRPLE